jgi:drug/metabolite transporter superfamily protein YnfA
MTTLIIALTIFAALCETFGTYTVWKNYDSTAKVAEEVIAQLGSSQLSEPPARRSSTERPFGRLSPAQIAESDANQRRMLREAIGHSMSPLRRNRLSTWGLIAYVLGAILGLVAALLAIA